MFFPAAKEGATAHSEKGFFLPRLGMPAEGGLVGVIGLLEVDGLVAEYGLAEG